MIARIEKGFADNKFGLWAAELRDSGEFIGFIGLSRPNFDAHFTPCVEVGWRLARRFWGYGYAPEGAAAVLEFGFNQTMLDEIISMTSTINVRSQRVMEKLHMTRRAEDDFLHPKIDDGDSLKPHVLYRLTKSDWLNAQKSP